MIKKNLIQIEAIKAIKSISFNVEDGFDDEEIVELVLSSVRDIANDALSRTKINY